MVENRLVDQPNWDDLSMVPIQNTTVPKSGQRKPKELRELVQKIAIDTGFETTRIVGGLRKMGSKKISRQTVRNILKEEGIEPNPDRMNDNWDTFIARHAETLWAVDFFSVKTVTTKGLRDMYVLVWLCMTTREIIVSESTLHPNSAWVTKQADLFVDQTAGRDKPPSIVMHDKDTKFSKDFTDKLKERDVRTNSSGSVGRCTNQSKNAANSCTGHNLRHLAH